MTDTHAWMNRLLRGEDVEECPEHRAHHDEHDVATVETTYGSADGGERDREPEPGPFNVNEALRAMWLWHRGL